MSFQWPRRWWPSSPVRAAGTTCAVSDGFDDAPCIVEAAGGVRMNTDPARAAAVEREARAMKARAGSQPKAFFRGTTDAGLPVLCGGNSVGDRAAMHAERGHYSLWVTTVAKPSGAYLAEATWRIVNLGDNSVALERKMEGPWLMAALPEGKYDVSATFKAEGASKDQTLSNRVTIGKKGLRQVVLRFDSSAEVSAESDSSVKGHPFGAP